MRLDRAAGRSIELRQLERRLQSKASRALLSRDRDSGEVGVLCAGGIFGIGLQQDVAVDAVKFGVVRAVPGPLG